MTASLLERALAAIRISRPALRARGVELIGVVGSVARGEDKAGSDVDIVYDLSERASLLALARALLDLEAALQRRVDLVNINRVDAELRAAFERDLVRA